MNRVVITFALLVSVLIAVAQLPQHWSDDDGIEVFQESTVVFNGTYSAGIIINSNDQNLCDFISTTEIPVTPGDAFKITFYGFTSQHVRARAFFYWVGATRTNSTNYLGPNTGGWEQFEFEATVPANATGLFLGVRFYAIPGFAPGQIQRLDDFSFESPAGNLLEVANGDFESWSSIAPEPGQYPDDFAAAAAGFNAVLNWSDPQNGQLPENYLIKVSTSDDISFPEDGAYIPNDLNLADGNGAVNVPYGKQTFTFTSLQSLTDYYFKIFPYTNSGANIDYKTDGSPPAAQIQTAEVTILEAENFDASWGNWNAVSITGDEAWNRNNNFGINNTPCARMTGANSGNILANEDWLISPALDFTSSENEVLTFFSAVGFSATQRQLTLKVSTDYDGESNPGVATWTTLDAVFPDGIVNFVWTFSGVVDLSAYESDNVHIAFVYTCDNTEASTWQIDNITITGEGVEIILPKPTEYPGDFVAAVSGTSVELTWTDAEGFSVPTGYLILATDQDFITPPVYGTPVEDDPELADGFGALNILPGVETATFENLLLGQSYYFEIFPYTNSGHLIDYKTDETPPNATVAIPVSTEIFFTDFNNNWGGWTPVSLFGTQVWNRNNNTGIDNSPCASIRGYAENPAKNEDWLISPPFTFDEALNHQINFFSSRNYEGEGLKIMASKTYNGTDNPNNFEWTDLSTLATWPTENDAWTSSGEIDLTPFTGSSFYVAFVYFSSTTQAAQWQLDNIQITASQVNDEPTNYPTEFSVAGGQKTIFATWTDAVGDVLPEGYLLLISEQPEIELPQDGTPVEDNYDLNDGNGAVNVAPGKESSVFVQLKISTTYYLFIIPYTNTGSLINYKTDGTLPSQMATTDLGLNEFLLTTFNESWQDWQQHKIQGNKTWDRNNNLGLNNSACASIESNSGLSEYSENWLISPPVNLENTINQTLDFFSAKSHNHGSLQILISDDYDGSENPPDFTWSDLSDFAILPGANQSDIWTWSESIDISEYEDKTIFIAFKFSVTAGYTARWMVDDIRISGQVTGIDEPKTTPQFSIYPNPGNGIFNYQISNPAGRIMIFNSMGVCVYTENISETNGVVDLTHLPGGFYFMKIANTETSGILTRKIIIQ